jgi:hypothetical protein
VSALPRVTDEKQKLVNERKNQNKFADPIALDQIFPLALRVHFHSPLLEYRTQEFSSAERNIVDRLLTETPSCFLVRSADRSNQQVASRHKLRS